MLVILLFPQPVFVEKPVAGGATSPVCVVAPNKLNKGDVPIVKGIALHTSLPGKITLTAKGAFDVSAGQPNDVAITV